MGAASAVPIVPVVRSTMLRQGCSPAVQLVRMVLSVGICWVGSLDSLAADDGKPVRLPSPVATAPRPSANQNTAVQNTAVQNTAVQNTTLKNTPVQDTAGSAAPEFDAARWIKDCDGHTAPLRFRPSGDAWPIGQPSQPSGLSVRVERFALHAGRDLKLDLRLVRIGDGSIITERRIDVHLDDAGSSDTLELVTEAPDREGAYELQCRLVEHATRIWPRWGRSTEDLAHARLPWLICHAPGADDRKATDSGVQFRPLRTLKPIDPESWQTPAWVPDQAARLVPDVRRVSDPWRISPWRSNAAENPHTLGPGESFISAVRDLKLGLPYQFSLDWETPPDQGGDLPLRVEYGQTPDFQSVTRSFPCRVRRRLEIPVGSKPPSGRQQWIHFAAGGTEFVRITNRSKSRSLLIRSLELAGSAESDRQLPPSLHAAPHRQVTLKLRGVAWTEDLFSTDENDRAADSGEATDHELETRALGELWQAARRLKDVAAWLGCQHVQIDNNATALQAAFQRVGITSESGRMIAAAAWDRWIRPTTATLSATGVGDRPAGVVEVRWEPLSIDPTVQLASHCGKDYPDRVALCCRAVPQVCDASLRSSIKSFQRTPTSCRPMTSPQPDSQPLVKVYVGEWTEPTDDDPANPLSITVVNPVPWASEVRLTFAGDGSTECSLIGARQDAWVDSKADGTTIVHVPPSAIINLEASSGAIPATLLSWRSETVGGAATIATLAETVARIVGSIGTLSYPSDYQQLANAGFEAEGQVGIVGWMHTQFPESAVLIDADEAVEGTRSIRMTTDTRSAGRTWLVSEPIAVPATGRLAVSMAVRAGAVVQAIDSGGNASRSSSATRKTGDGEPAVPGGQADSANHRVRVSLEGNLQGRPYRVASEMEVPRDGKWQQRRIVLEADALPSGRLDAMRLTIDSLSEGRLWIDDVHLHDRFATQSERAAFGGKAFLAVQGLRRDDLAPAAELLSNPWTLQLAGGPESESGRDVWSSRPPKARPSTGGDRQPSPAENDTLDGSQPDSKDPPPRRQQSVAERIRHWLPRPLRF